MSLLERLDNYSSKSNDNKDIQYLKDSSIGGVVCRGLAEVYKIQPKKPITFLANWLINESRSKEIKKNIDENEILKQKIFAEYEMRNKIKELVWATERHVKLTNRNKKGDFMHFLLDCNDFEENLNMICDKIKEIIHSTGVYFMIYDKKRKSVTPDDDENGHLVDVNVIRYIAFNSDHSFLKDKYLEPDTGVTYDLYKPKEESGEQPVADPVPDDDQPKITLPVEQKLKDVYIKEVVLEPRVKFFREPRLGCYLAIDLSYNSSLNPISLQTSIDFLNEYEIKKGEQDMRRKEFEMRLEEDKKAKENQVQEEGEGQADIQVEEKKFEEEPIILQEFEKVEKKLILAVDTLGQDRLFSEREEKFIFDAAILMKKSWEILEKRLLEKDRDKKREMIILENSWKEINTVEKLENDESKYIKEYFASEKFLENPINDDKLKAIETDLCKSRFIINSFFDDENLKTLFLSFKDYEFVENEKIFQQFLYFVRIPNTDINEENTNKLNWKKAKKYWNIKILEKIRDYNPIGPKSAVSQFFMGNRIMSVLESYDKESLFKYSVSLSRLLDLVLLLLNIRKTDILNRREIISNLKDKRNQKIQEKEARAVQRDEALEEARKIFLENLNPETPEEEQPKFNEEEFTNKWDEEHPDIEIPEDVEYDKDDDFDLGLETETNPS